jgi:hypothetical protein
MPLNADKIIDRPWVKDPARRFLMSLHPNITLLSNEDACPVPSAQCPHLTVSPTS